MALARVTSEAVARFGPVTGLVNNAGRNSYADPVKMTEAEWDDVFAVDLKAAWLAARAVLPGMITAKAGSIVNIASVHADMTYPGFFPYAAAKSGLVGLTRSLAQAFAEDGIRVNAIAPGWINTQISRRGRENPDFNARVMARLPAKRWADPMELAGTALFLASPAARFVNGATIPVDGGYSAT
jgi:NAD(P)-dependent dehydrogenase (short-subunit alcohol dehydrogenase family)